MIATHRFAGTLLAVLTASLLVTVPPAEMAQAAKRFESTAVMKLNFTKLKPGTNLLDRNASGFSLYCVARKGQPLKFLIKDPAGKVIPSTMTRSATTCWECGKDASGNTHCWKIPCPVIIGPWDPSKVNNMKAIQ